MDQMSKIPASVGDLLARIEVVPWFGNVGRPTPADAIVRRIWNWEGWPGPLDLGVAMLHERQQELYDAVVADAGGERTAQTVLWDRIHAAVFRIAVPRVPYDPHQDCYHGPTTSVWAAAYTIGLLGLYLQSGRSVPPDLWEQWAWYAWGDWPCGYTVVDNDPGPVLVY